MIKVVSVIWVIGFFFVANANIMIKEPIDKFLENSSNSRIPSQANVDKAKHSICKIVINSGGNTAILTGM